MTAARVPSLGHQLLEDPLGPLVFALAKLMMANTSLRIDEIEGRPVLVAESTPDGSVAIDRDGIIHPQVLCGSANVVDVLLEREFGRVHADDHQPFILVFLG